ncbi:MAG: DinB family protein [Candidatus Solibacter usitatus]|nr:DinB family protein [Candidatus Solibacter usitatus]
MKLTAKLTGLMMFAALALCAQAPAPTVAKIMDNQLATIERELVPLVEAIPADKMGFAPTQGEFKGARTFAQQATHTAAVVYAVAASALGEKNPIDMGKNENGPATIKTKAEVLDFVKAAFAYGHKATAALTEKNMTEMMQSPFGSGKIPRLSAVSIAVWHSFDHYGQMAVYARMNGIVPPASRGQ